MFPTSNHPLGKKLTSVPSKDLGTQACFQDIDYASTAEVKAQLSNMMVQAVLVKQTGATAIAPGAVVKWSVPGTEVAAVAGDEEVGCGVVDPYLSSSVAQNEYCWIITKGPVDVITAAGITAGAALSTAAAGKVKLNDYAVPGANIGRLIDASSTDGDVRRAIVDFRNW